jgi:ankyrin repeat protein
MPDKKKYNREFLQGYKMIMLSSAENGDIENFKKAFRVEWLLQLDASTIKEMASHLLRGPNDVVAARFRGISKKLIFILAKNNQIKLIEQMEQVGGEELVKCRKDVFIWMLYCYFTQGRDQQEKERLIERAKQLLRMDRRSYLVNALYNKSVLFLKAIQTQDDELINLFLANGYDADQIYAFSMTAMSWAYVQNNLELFKQLLERGVSLEAQVATRNYLLSAGLSYERLKPFINTIKVEDYCCESVAQFFLRDLSTDEKKDFLNKFVDRGGEVNKFFESLIALFARDSYESLKAAESLKDFFPEVYVLIANKHLKVNVAADLLRRWFSCFYRPNFISDVVAFWDTHLAKLQGLTKEQGLFVVCRMFGYMARPDVNAITYLRFLLQQFPALGCNPIIVLASIRDYLNMRGSDLLRKESHWLTVVSLVEGLSNTLGLQIIEKQLEHLLKTEAKPADRERLTALIENCMNNEKTGEVVKNGKAVMTKIDLFIQAFERNDCEQVAKLFKQYRFLVNCRDLQGRPYFFKAIETNNKELMRLFIANKVDLAMLGPGGETALARAVMQDNRESFELLLRRQCEPHLYTETLKYLSKHSNLTIESFFYLLNRFPIDLSAYLNVLVIGEFLKSKSEPEQGRFKNLLFKNGRLDVLLLLVTHVSDTAETIEDGFLSACQWIAKGMVKIEVLVEMIETWVERVSDENDDYFDEVTVNDLWKGKLKDLKELPKEYHQQALKPVAYTLAKCGRLAHMQLLIEYYPVLRETTTLLEAALNEYLGCDFAYAEVEDNYKETIEYLLDQLVKSGKLEEAKKQKSFRGIIDSCCRYGSDIWAKNLLIRYKVITADNLQKAPVAGIDFFSNRPAVIWTPTPLPTAGAGAGSDPDEVVHQGNGAGLGAGAGAASVSAPVGAQSTECAVAEHDNSGFEEPVPQGAVVDSVPEEPEAETGAEGEARRAFEAKQRAARQKAIDEYKAEQREAKRRAKRRARRRIVVAAEVGHDSDDSDEDVGMEPAPDPGQSPSR